ncbi:MAG: thermonuclease family protein [Mesorhizobium sp.]
MLRSAVFAAALFVAGAASAAVAVLDGDSLDIDGKRVELWGIIAPAKSETCRTSTGRDWACGQAVFDQLRVLSEDETFSCSEKETGFVVCSAGGLDVGRLLVKEGLARARQDYHDAEARAREAKIGLWE